MQVFCFYAAFVLISVWTLRMLPFINPELALRLQMRLLEMIRDIRKKLQVEIKEMERRDTDD